MPRTSLSPKMKKFRSFEILITQTRPEDIWSFFTDKMLIFDKKSKYYIDRIEKLLEEIKEYNHYIEFDFYEPMERIDLYKWSDDDYFAFIKEFINISKDMELCETVLWCDEEDQDKRDFLFEWIGSIGSFVSNIQFFRHELTYCDNKNYNVVIERHRQHRLKKELERKLINDHLKHDEAEHYTEPHVEDEHYYLKFDGSKVYFDKDCKICTTNKTFYLTYRFAEDKLMFEERQEQNRKKEELEAKRIADKQKHESQLANLQDIVCECCEYKTKSKYDFKEHLESKDHQTKYKLKNWHCSKCNTQARSELEWSYHIKTKKHKIGIGEEEGKPEKYHCEACDYTCTLKTHWNQHIAGKKHQSK